MLAGRQTRSGLLHAFGRFGKQFSWQTDIPVVIAHEFVAIPLVPHSRSVLQFTMSQTFTPCEEMQTCPGGQFCRVPLPIGQLVPMATVHVQPSPE